MFMVYLQLFIRLLKEMFSKSKPGTAPSSPASVVYQPAPSVAHQPAPYVYIRIPGQERLSYLQAGQADSAVNSPRLSRESV